MSTRRPTFRAENEVYRADTCDPLTRAVDEGCVSLHALARGHYPGDRLTARQLPHVKSVGFWHAVGRQSWGLDWHRNEGLELTFVEKGQTEFAVERASHRLQPNDLTITRPWQRHRVGDPHISPCRLHWLILDVDVRRPNQTWCWPDWMILTRSDLGRLTDMLRHNEQPVWRTDSTMRGCWRKISNIVEHAALMPFESRLTIAINELFIHLLEIFDRHQIELDERLSSSHRTVELFFSELTDNVDRLAHPWQVAEMAEACGLGVTQFTAICRELTNTTPSQHLTDLRIERAKRMLQQQTVPNVTQVAQRLGFSTSQYFATVFRNQTGMTPSGWNRR